MKLSTSALILLAIASSSEANAVRYVRGRRRKAAVLVRDDNQNGGVVKCVNITHTDGTSETTFPCADPTNAPGVEDTSDSKDDKGVRALKESNILDHIGEKLRMLEGTGATVNCITITGQDGTVQTIGPCPAPTNVPTDNSDSQDDKGGRRLLETETIEQELRELEKEGMELNCVSVIHEDGTVTTLMPCKSQTPTVAPDSSDSKDDKGVRRLVDTPTQDPGADTTEDNGATVDCMSVTHEDGTVTTLMPCKSKAPVTLAPDSSDSRDDKVGSP